MEDSKPTKLRPKLKGFLFKPFYFVFLIVIIDNFSSSSPYLCRLCNFQSTTMSGLLLHIQRRQHRPSGNRGMSRSQLATSLEPTNDHSSVTSTQLLQPIQQQQQQSQQPRLVFRSSKSSTTTSNAVNGSASVAAFQNGHQLATSAGDVIYVLNPVKTLPQQQQQQQQQLKLSGEKSPFYQIQRVVLVNVSH